MSRWVFLQAFDSTDHDVKRRWYGRLRQGTDLVEVVAMVNNAGHTELRLLSEPVPLRNFEGVHLEHDSVRRREVFDWDDDRYSTFSLAGLVEDLGSLLATGRREFGSSWGGDL